MNKKDRQFYNSHTHSREECEAMGEIWVEGYKKRDGSRVQSYCRMRRKGESLPAGHKHRYMGILDDTGTGGRVCIGCGAWADGRNKEEYGVK